jgi:hypothetical protein
VNLREWSLQAVVLKVLADEITTRLMLVKQAARDAFDETGATQAVPELPDGTRVAAVTLAGGGGKTASVTNEAVFLAWMAEHHPEELVTVVRDNAKRKILDGCKAAGAAVDPGTGELIPGVTVSESRPYVSIRLKPGGKDAVVAAWQAGELSAIELVAPPAIEAGAA